jgi:uncharacterized membrane protein (DUF4010 family)
VIESPLLGAIVCLLVGLLLGLERERSQSKDERLFAGIRTFPLLVLAGFLAARFPERSGHWVLPAVLLSVGALAIVSYRATSRTHAGTTTEVLAMLAPLLGATAAWGHAAAAAALAVVITLLLTLKAPLHRIAGAITEDEIVAIVKFGLVAVVLVPLLPDEPVGPYQAVVPRHVGLVVVIVCAVSLVGYLLVRLLGGRTGWALVGLLGGLVSSTAVTLSLAGRARSQPELARPLATGVLLASTVLYLRVLFLVSLFVLPLGLHTAPRALIPFAVLAVFALREWRGSGRGAKGGEAGIGNPVELGRALALGVLFAALLLAGRAAQVQLGAAGLWATGALGGLVDVDAVALAGARLHQQGHATPQAAGGAILLATAANLVLKAVIVLVAGGGAFGRRLLPAFACAFGTTLVTLFF